MSDKRYIWEQVKQDYRDKKDIPWKQLLNEKSYSYSTIQSYIIFSKACESRPMILISTDYYS